MSATIERTSAPSGPRRVGRYEVLAPLGSGGMAGVFLARTVGAHGFERLFALKLMHAHLLESDSHDWASAFIAEAKLAARIRHPNVVAVVDFGEDESGMFLVMEYVEGDTVGRLCRGVELPIPMRVRLLCDALAGLHAAHELRDDGDKPMRLVHRDFTPQNLLVGVDGVTRLTDFGIAKVADLAAETRTNLVKGKAGYIAPEQARMLPLDRRCDVWSAGVVAWEAFAGRRLFVAEGDPVGCLLQICTVDAPRLRTLRPDIPAALEEAVAWALERDPARRCPTADDLRRALLAALGAGVAPADSAEVAAFVASRVGPKLAARRRLLEGPLSGERAGGAADSASSLTPSAAVAELRGDDVTAPTVRGAGPSPSFPSTSRRRTWSVLAAFAAAGAGVVLYSARSPITAPVDKDGTQAAASAEVRAADAPGESGSSASRPSEVPASGLRIEANAPIAQVAVGGRTIVVAKPSTELLVEHDATDVDAPVEVSARALDGRTAIVTVPAGGRSVSIDFAAPDTPPRSRGLRPPGGAAKRARAAVSSGPNMPLADSPYGPRK